ncbi:hypothetical protein N8303_01035 [Gammaproteobacteria bacterium]|nr:hypothetical protein [Gammaproteobacteria bacterium]
MKTKIEKLTLVLFSMLSIMTGSIVNAQSGTGGGAYQADLQGFWTNTLNEDNRDRGEGPYLGDYLGLPLNEAAKRAAEVWDPTILSLEERQCNEYSADYAAHSVGHQAIWKEVDPFTNAVIAWRMRLSWMGGQRTIWMDGRPHPPEGAPHTWLGFSTGEWVGPTLIVTTSHLKNTWLRRNGVPRSDKAYLVQYFTRLGNILTIVDHIYDPVYLTEPLVRSSDYIFNPAGTMGTFVCEAVEEAPRDLGVVPHYLPGENPYLIEFYELFEIPIEVMQDGAEMLYPEYLDKLEEMLEE